VAQTNSKSSAKALLAASRVDVDGSSAVESGTMQPAEVVKQRKRSLPSNEWGALTAAAAAAASSAADAKQSARALKIDVAKTEGRGRGRKRARTPGSTTSRSDLPSRSPTGGRCIEDDEPLPLAWRCIGRRVRIFSEADNQWTLARVLEYDPTRGKAGEHRLDIIDYEKQKPTWLNVTSRNALVGGDIVWAKMKGFSAWPAQIYEQTPRCKSSGVLIGPEHNAYVVFFGKDDSAWVPAATCKEFIYTADPPDTGDKRSPSGALQAAKAAAKAELAQIAKLNRGYDVRAAYWRHMATCMPSQAWVGRSITLLLQDQRRCSAEVRRYSAATKQHLIVYPPSEGLRAEWVTLNEPRYAVALIAPDGAEVSVAAKPARDAAGTSSSAAKSRIRIGGTTPGRPSVARSCKADGSGGSSSAAAADEDGYTATAGTAVVTVAGSTAQLHSLEALLQAASSCDAADSAQLDSSEQDMVVNDTEQQERDQYSDQQQQQQQAQQQQQQQCSDETCVHCHQWGVHSSGAGSGLLSCCQCRKLMHGYCLDPPLDDRLAAKLLAVQRASNSTAGELQTNRNSSSSSSKKKQSGLLWRCPDCEQCQGCKRTRQQDPELKLCSRRAVHMAHKAVPELAVPAQWEAELALPGVNGRAWIVREEEELYDDVTSAAAAAADKILLCSRCVLRFKHCAYCPVCDVSWPDEGEDSDGADSCSDAEGAAAGDSSRVKVTTVILESGGALAVTNKPKKRRGRGKGRKSSAAGSSSSAGGSSSGRRGSRGTADTAAAAVVVAGDSAAVAAAAAGAAASSSAAVTAAASAAVAAAVAAATGEDDEDTSEVFTDPAANMIQCERCSCWVHAKCDGVRTDAEFAQVVANTHRLWGAPFAYHCPVCRGIGQRAALRLLSDADANDLFFDPVSEAQAPRYGESITEPMSLSVVGQRIAAARYRGWQALRDDVELIAENALVYNPPGSQVHGLARQFFSAITQVSSAADSYCILVSDVGHDS
jgi:Bromodomain/PWWP domain